MLKLGQATLQMAFAFNALTKLLFTPKRFARDARVSMPNLFPPFSRKSRRRRVARAQKVRAQLRLTGFLRQVCFQVFAVTPYAKTKLKQALVNTLRTEHRPFGGGCLSKIMQPLLDRCSSFRQCQKTPGKQFLQVRVLQGSSSGSFQKSVKLGADFLGIKVSSSTS